ncbi:hypothetical protein WICPIJ_009558 [Wickerhamomyces pijperi]|uniref:Uncharacterized protein n=1 Tax=Wickerhamomyces pijperi TaxID=599730 RepID=A0A9P8PN44_WICPI|nr:hypothetical protein WICPIJ_009558 [Wickerhamomyces pijperi]
MYSPRHSARDMSPSLQVPNLPANRVNPQMANGINNVRERIAAPTICQIPAIITLWKISLALSEIVNNFNALKAFKPLTILDNFSFPCVIAIMSIHKETNLSENWKKGLSYSSEIQNRELKRRFNSDILINLETVRYNTDPFLVSLNRSKKLFEPKLTSSSSWPSEVKRSSSRRNSWITIPLRSNFSTLSVLWSGTVIVLVPQLNMDLRFLTTSTRDSANFLISRGNSTMTNLWAWNFLFSFSDTSNESPMIPMKMFNTIELDSTNHAMNKTPLQKIENLLGANDCMSNINSDQFSVEVITNKPKSVFGMFWNVN